MTAGRRALSAVLLGGAALLAGPAPAQHQRPHDLWDSDLSADRIRAALAQLKAGGLDPFGKMVKDRLLADNPGLKLDPGVVDKAIKDLTRNPELMRQWEDFARQRMADPGRPGKVTPKDFDDFLDKRPPGDLAKLLDGFKKGGDRPPPDPAVGPPPPGKNGDPQPPERPKRPVEPPGKFDPPADPPAVKDQDPITLNENPFGRPDGPADPRAKSLDALADLWERNIGSLDQTPELKRALFDLANGENGFDFDLTDADGNSLWDLIKNGGLDGMSLADLLDGGNWSLGDWELPKLGGDWGLGGWNWGGGGGTNRPPPAPTGGSSGGPGWGSGWGPGGVGGVWVPFLILLLIVLGVVVWLKVRSLNLARAAPAFAAAAAGGWPLDPRAIATREDVVKAFEYLSVLVCGPAARNWTHGTIAEALADLARSGGERALLLARLYELARYAPLDEPLSRSEVVEARALVCLIAGVDP